MAKPNEAVSGCLGVFGIALFVVVWAKASFGAAIAVALGVFVLAVVLGVRAQNARRKALAARFGSEIADAIIAKKFWQGATYEMMREAHGEPIEVRQKVLKQKTRETHCYQQTAKNRFALRLHYEDGEVVGWDA